MASQISLTLPLSQGFYRMKRLLFEPFDAVKWLTIGFCAWLAQLGSGRAGIHYNSRFHGRLPNIVHVLEQIRSYFTLHLFWMLPLAAVGLLVGLAIAVLILWLSSRGQFMFVHCIARERADVQFPWDEYRREARSLFLFRLVVSLILLVVAVPFAGSFLFLLLPILPQHAGAVTAVKILVLVTLAMVSVVFALAGLILGKLTRDFVVPIQFARRCTCVEAWRILIRLISANPADFLIYLLFQIVLWIALSAALFVLALITCCVAGCLLALPYIGTVLRLPIEAFQRAFSLHYLAQFGPDYSPVSP